MGQEVLPKSEIAQEMVPARLAEIHAVGDDFLTEIVQVFKESSAEILNQLQTSVHKKNATDTKSHIHSLKGAIINMGFLELTKQINELNGLAKTGNLAQIEILLPAFEAEFQRINQMIP